MKTILFTILLSIIASMTPFTHKQEKLESLGANQFHIDEKSEKWLSAGSGHCEVWKGKQQCAVAYLSFYLNGELFLDEDVIDSGYFRYNYKKEAYESQKNVGKLAKETYFKSPTRSAYMLTKSVFDKDKKRLLITLRHRPTRIPNFVEPNDIPNYLVALIDTKADTVIKVVEAMPIHLFVARTKDYFVVHIDGKVQVWDILSGKLVAIEGIENDQIDYLTAKSHANHILIVSKKGLIFKYDIDSKIIETITQVEKPAKIFVLNKKDVYAVVTNKKNAAIYNKNKVGEYDVITQFTTESNINDVFHDIKTSILYVATNDRKFPITRYLDVKIIGD